MTQVATVEKILDSQHAEISVPRKSACGHDCEDCAGCGVSGAAVHATAINLIGAAPGQKVVVESSSKKLLGIVGLVYLVPILLFFIGYFFAGAVGAGNFQYAAAGMGFVVGFIPALVYDRYMRRQGGLSFNIVRLF